MSKEKQDIKLEKVDDKTAYENLLVKYAELENKIADIKANCDLAIEGRDIKIKELELELTVEKDQHQEEINLHLHAEDYIKSLEQQIEKMKCCENCKYNSYWGNELHCNYGLKEALQEDKLVECHNLDKWKLKE